jgi:hypothetical protein
MFRHALKNAAKKVFIGENPVEAADKMKQAADAIIKGTTSQYKVMRPVTPQGYRTFSVPRSSPNPISYSTNSPITPKYEFQPQTPVKSNPSDTELGPLLPKLPRHRSSMQMQTPLSYAPTYTNPGNVIRRNLFD